MTTIINFFGSSGAGKSTLSLELTSTLKKLGYNTDYVPEYAKELVYQKNYSLLSKPFSIFSTQKERIDLLVDNNLDLAVTDSPLLLSSFYGSKYNYSDELFEHIVLHEHNKYDNINFFVNRTVDYKQEGRLELEEKSNENSYNLSEMLRRLNIQCVDINSDTPIKDIVSYIENALTNTKEIL